LNARERTRESGSKQFAGGSEKEIKRGDKMGEKGERANGGLSRSNGSINKLEGPPVNKWVPEKKCYTRSGVERKSS